MAETTLFHVSDVHFGVENRDALDWFAAAVADEKPAAVLCTGDITQRATHEQFAAAREYFAGLGVPVTIEPGNHDMPYYNLWERFTDPYRRLRTLDDVVTPQLDLGRIAVVPLKTTVRIQPRFPWSDGYVRDEALADTLRRLKAVRDSHDYVIVTCHHPLVPAKPGEKNPTIGGDEAFSAIGMAGADAVLSGHVHLPFDLRRDAAGREVHVVGAGTISTRLRGAPVSYNVLRYAAGSGLAVERRELPSQ
ncbi:metallophosphoesterase [Altererythrobacter sp. ZODW24]|uniref:metallophosphoesterase family protein n=1 Tax=Altererythrobacter sp. ZODW24 TaxID=2185142 RepID=UPI000DF85ABA|nr:metallophosphoesterase [Altererythrobacter sp. ZODW24]